jgi:HEAT repeat protein
MNVTATSGQRNLLNGKLYSLFLLAFAYLMSAPIQAQNESTQTQSAPATQPASTTPVELEAPATTLPSTSTADDRTRQAWTILTNAATDSKHTQTRIQALAALQLLDNPRSAHLITGAMADSELDVRTAAVMAAGATRDRHLIPDLRKLLDDKEPQVAFSAAMTLWKMGDRSGADILMAVVNGQHSAGPTMIHGAEHRVDNDLHNPAMLARLGAMQGASMLLGPFGFGITAFEFIHQSGGDLARVSAIEEAAHQRTPTVHTALQNALADKDPTVRAAAAKALADYRDSTTSLALYALFADSKYPVRLTAAAAYLRTTGVQGPTMARNARLPTRP